MTEKKATPGGITTGVRKRPLLEGERYSDWAHPRNHKKYATRGDVIQAVNHALNVYRIKHTLLGRVRLWWAVRRQQRAERAK